MTKYLLLIKDSDDTTTVEEWLKEMDEPIDIIYILNEDIPEEVSSWMLYTGFLGEKPTEDVVNAIKNEMKIRAEERLGALKKKFPSIETVDTRYGRVEMVMKENAGKYQKIFITKGKDIEEVV